jgi:hypothetical protein
MGISILIQLLDNIKIDCFGDLQGKWKEIYLLGLHQSRLEFWTGTQTWLVLF